MDDDFTRGRNNPLTHLTPTYLNGLLGAVAGAFDISWLSQAPHNRIQILWARQDALATNQLAILGDALKRMTPGNENWVTRRVNAVKGENGNNHKGDLFELLALSMFVVDGQQVLPAKEAQPGYDGTVTFRNGAQAIVSLKDFGSSAHQNGFELRATETETRLIAALTKERVTGLGLRLSARHYVERLNEWTSLHNRLPNLVKDCVKGRLKGQVSDVWDYFAGKIATNGFQIDPQRTSYSLTIYVPHHRNEQKNIESKIQGACYNLAKHSADLPEHQLPVLFIRLPESAAPSSCSRCAQEWLNSRPSAAVGVVVLYQPVVAMIDQKEGTFGIVHFIDLIAGDRFSRWQQSTGWRQAIKAEVVVGTCTNMPTSLRLTDGSELCSRYMYQRGQIYTSFTSAPNGTLSGQMSNPAPGIMVNLVLRIPGKSGEVIMYGKFPPDGKLLLYA